jgi:molybdopterin molybdotransferase
MAGLLSLEEALEAVLSRVRSLPAEPVRLERLAGRVLAEPARATVALPPFPASAMDGFALRAEDTPGRLPIAFRIAAGSPAPGPLEPGEAMAIATGGVVPDGANAVVPVERVSEVAGEVEVPERVAEGANVRPRGGDVAEGAEVVGKGTRVGPGQLGALAAAGIAEVSCHCRPRAAVLATGSELRAPGQLLGPGEVYEANGLMLEAQLRDSGAEVERLQAAVDDEEAHRDAIARGLEHHVLVTSGGVSVGPHDLVRRVEADLGVDEVFWGVAVKPGKPVSFGVRGATLVFGLPGNPVSSLVACELFVRPAVLALQGAAAPGPRFSVAALGSEVRQDPRRDQLLRARWTETRDGPRLVPVEGQESHMIVRAAEAEALALVPRGDGSLPAGTAVKYLSL